MIFSFTSSIKNLWGIPNSIVWASYEAFLHGRCHGNLQNGRWELGFRDVFDEIAFTLYIGLSGRRSIQLGFLSFASLLILSMFPLFTVEQTIAKSGSIQVALAFTIIFALLALVLVFVPSVQLVKFHSSLSTVFLIGISMLVCIFYSSCSTKVEYFDSLTRCRNLANGHVPVIPSLLVASVPWLLSFALRCRWWHATIGGLCSAITYCATILKFAPLDISIPIACIVFFFILVCSVGAFSFERDIRAGFKREGAIRRKLQSVLNDKAPGLIHSNMKQKVLTSLAFLESVLTEVDESMVIKWASLSVAKTIGGHSNSANKRNFLENVHKDDVEMIRTEFTNLLQYAKLQSLEAVYRGRQHLHVPIIRVQYRRRNQIHGIDDEASANNPGSWSWREAEIRPLIWKPQKVPGAPKFISYGLRPDGESIIGPLEAGKLGETSALILERSIFEDRRRIVEMGFGHLLPTTGRIVASTTIDADIFAVGASAGIPYPPSHFNLDATKYSTIGNEQIRSLDSRTSDKQPSSSNASSVRFDAHFERSMYTLFTSMLLSLSSMEMLLPAGLAGIRTITKYLLQNVETIDSLSQKEVQTPTKANAAPMTDSSSTKSITNFEVSPAGTRVTTPVQTDGDSQTDQPERTELCSFLNLENALMSSVEILSLVSETLPHLRGSILDALTVSRSRCSYVPVREGVPIQWRNLVAKSVFFSTKRINTMVQTAAIIAMQKGRERDEMRRDGITKRSPVSHSSSLAMKVPVNEKLSNGHAWEDLFPSTSGILPFSVSISLSFRSNFPSYLLADVLHAPRLLDIALAAVTAAVSKRYTNILRPRKQIEGAQDEIEADKRLERDISVWYTRDMVRVAPVLITVTAGKNTVETNSVDSKGNRISSRDSVRIEFAFDSSGVGGIRGISEALSLDPLIATGPHAIPQPGTFFTPSYPPKVLEQLLKRDVDNVQSLLTQSAPMMQPKLDEPSPSGRKQTNTLRTTSSQKLDATSESRTGSAAGASINRMSALLDLLLPETFEKPATQKDDETEENPTENTKGKDANTGRKRQDGEMEEPDQVDATATSEKVETLPPTSQGGDKGHPDSGEKTKRGSETTKRTPLLPTYSTPSLLSLLQGTISQGSAVSASPYSTVYTPTARELANVLDVRLLLPLLRHEILCLGGGVATCSASPDMVAAIQAASGTGKAVDRKSVAANESLDSETTLPSGTDICVLILDIPCPAVTRQVVPGKSAPSAQEVTEELHRSHVGSLPDAQEVMKELKVDKLYDGGDLGPLHHPMHSRAVPASRIVHQAQPTIRKLTEPQPVIPAVIVSSTNHPTTQSDPRAQPASNAYSQMHDPNTTARNANALASRKDMENTPDSVANVQRRIQVERKLVPQNLPSAPTSPIAARPVRVSEGQHSRIPVDMQQSTTPDSRHTMYQSSLATAQLQDTSSHSQTYTQHVSHASGPTGTTHGLSAEIRLSESHLSLQHPQSRTQPSPGGASSSSGPDTQFFGVAQQHQPTYLPAADPSPKAPVYSSMPDTTAQEERRRTRASSNQRTADQQNRRRSEGKKRILSGETKDLRVLFVDDDNVNRRQGFKMLSRLGCIPIMASDGDEVLSILQHATMNNKSIDCVLMDIVMQRQNGDVTCSLVRNMGYELPIVAMTGAFAARDVDSFLKNGFTLVLPKPFDLTQMERAIITSRKNVQARQQSHKK